MVRNKFYLLYWLKFRGNKYVSDNLTMFLFSHGDEGDFLEVEDERAGGEYDFGGGE